MPLSYTQIKTLLSQNNRKIEDKFDAMCRKTVDTVSVLCTENVKQLNDIVEKHLVYVKEYMKLYAEATAGVIRGTYGPVLEKIESVLPEGKTLVGTDNKSGEPDYLGRKMNNDQANQIADILRTAVKEVLNDVQPKVKVPNFEKMVLDAMRVGTIETCKHNSDMRGTDSALTAIPHSELVISDEDIDKIASIVSKKVLADESPSPVRVAITEYNQLNNSPLEGVVVTAYRNGTKSYVAYTNEDGVAILQLYPGEYLVKKQKEGWTFTDQRMVI